MLARWGKKGFHLLCHAKTPNSYCVKYFFLLHRADFNTALTNLKVGCLIVWFTEYMV